MESEPGSQAIRSASRRPGYAQTRLAGGSAQRPGASATWPSTRQLIDQLLGGCLLVVPPRLVRRVAACPRRRIRFRPSLSTALLGCALT